MYIFMYFPLVWKKTCFNVTFIVQNWLKFKSVLVKLFYKIFKIKPCDTKVPVVEETHVCATFL